MAVTLIDPRHEESPIRDGLTKPQRIVGAVKVAVVVFGTVVLLALLATVLVLSVALFVPSAWSRDLGGQWKDSPLAPWVRSLASPGHGNCCSFADGRAVVEEDWGTQEKPTSHYWVVVDGAKLDVPDDAVVATPNKLGSAVVWPYKDSGGKMLIRCFLAGTMS